MSTTTDLPTEPHSYSLETFTIRRPSADPRPGVAWKAHTDLAKVGRDVTGGGEEDATLLLRLNVDHGEFDIVAADHSGYDEVQLLDRAIAVLTDLRVAFQNLTGGTDGWCLTRNSDGDSCRMRGAHDDHDYRTASGD